MPRPSSVDRLGPEVREQIGRLLDEGRSLDEIMAHLGALEVREISRSALGRYTQRVNKLSENRRRAMFVAQAVERDFGADPENKLLRHLIKSVEVDLFDILNSEDPDAPPPDAKSSLTVAQTLERLVRTSRHDAALRETIEKRAAEKERKAAAGRASEAAKAKGMSSETADFIAAQVLGVTA